MEKHDATDRTSTHDEEDGMRAWPNTEDNDMERAIEEAEEPTHHDAGREKPTGLAGTLSRTISRRSAASSWQDPGPPPDGGAQAWTQAACVHLTIFSTFGYITSFGVFQTYYENTLGVDPSAISWIGSIQIFLLFGIGTFTGRATDAGLFRPVYIAGAVFQIVGIFCQAQATNFWQLFLSQALCIGIANGLQFCPAMSLITTYFAKKRALAVGITALGSCTGGVVFPVIVQQLLPKVGYPWTVRVIGFIMLFTNVVTITFLRTRLPPRKSGPIVDWASFKELPFALYCIAMFFNFWGLYFVFFYIGSYGRNVLGVSYQQSINLLLTVVCVGFIFRLVPNYFADKIGSLNTLIPFSLLSAVMMFGWIGIHTLPALYVFAAIYGCGSACIQALWPAVIGNLNKVPDLKKAGVRMGMAFTVVSFASLTGPPLAGALIQQNGGSYLHAQIWGGVSFLIGFVGLVATRWSIVGWDPKGIT
ncbi:Putative major facilitator superfamily, MFS transporter superfamily [Septoria linicola]|uniref:Major facilitator superfamily, MFS transporter superfamily n=1 Tax=Septoria linicola TaxID=215465 RepID=A0A9Q9B1S8_9PEZI|nr:Putative major facilitator superfamily, MFS transporter superfamily [Septoria linicola]